MKNEIERILAHLDAEREHSRDVMRAAMSQFANGTRLKAARPVLLRPQSLLWGGGCRLVGWSVRAVGGVATLNLRNGRDSSADIVATITLSADGVTATQWLGPGGVDVGEALWADYAAGAVTGTVYLGAVD